MRQRSILHRSKSALSTVESIFCAGTILQSRLRRASSLYTREPCVGAPTVSYFAVQEYLSDGKTKNECGTRVSLPCVKGGGPRSGGRIVSGHKDTFYSLSDGKEKSERCTSVSPPLVREGGPRSGGWD